jgi:hypothetical protein
LKAFKVGITKVAGLISKTFFFTQPLDLDGNVVEGYPWSGEAQVIEGLLLSIVR